MAANKRPHRFEKIVDALPKTGTLPDRLRFSRMAGLLSPEARAEFERDRATAAHCPKHGELKDPAVFLVGEGSDRRVAFACPWCSGADVLSQWQKEGAS